MRYFVVDAFTDAPFGGNPAGVVLLGEGVPFLPDSLMISIAAELRYSETAFVQQNGPAEFTVRYFTPAAEVDLCGHATIASFCVLRDERIVPEGTVCLNHTLAGDLEVIVGKEVMMQMASPEVIEKPLDTCLLHRIMMQGREENDLSGSRMSLEPEIVSTGLPDIIMPVGSIEELQAISPDMDALAALSRDLDVVGVHAFALSDDGHTAHVRNFAPLYGIPEESATGTANAALTYYLYRHNLAHPGSRCSFMQGEAMGRPSVVSTLLGDDSRVYVGGNSYILASGELMLP